jgi:menaquinol-cytochrome c reductase iron-sulfur subunit
MVKTVVQPGSGEELSRRQFYLVVIYGLWGLICVALAAPALLYLLLPSRLRLASEWVEAGDVTKLAPNVPVEMVFRTNRTDGWKVTSEKQTTWVVKLPDQKIVAFGPQCTHLGCAYHWEAGKSQFLCPCHSSVFSIDGNVVSGPAPRPLDRYETKIQNGKLLVGALKESPETDA